MTTNEFSNEFDTLIQSYIQKIDFGNVNTLAFDEYEKSVFLTKAQEEIVLNIYKGVGEFDSFENSEQSRRLLSSLIETIELSPIESVYNTPISKNSYFIQLPDDLMSITYEAVLFDSTTFTCGKDKFIPVAITSQDELHRILENPFRRNSNNRVLRLDINNNSIEIISTYKIAKYIIRYIRIPSPILLVDLPDDLSINGKTTKSECELNPSLHRKILEKAVSLAISSKNINK